MSNAAYIVDIDGTIADLTHRLHHIQNKPKNWPAFFDACEDDAPIEHMVPIVSALWFVGHVIFMSGRPGRLRDATQRWLKKHNFNYSMEPARLYMRADGDYRDDSIVKCELLARVRLDGYRPVFCFDDRTRVVNMWRENGIPCAQVAPGDF